MGRGGLGLGVGGGGYTSHHSSVFYGQSFVAASNEQNIHHPGASIGPLLGNGNSRDSR